MKVIKTGRIKLPESTHKWRFTCIYCESLLEGDEETGDLVYAGTLGAGIIFRYKCPVCKRERLIDIDRLEPCQ